MPRRKKQRKPLVMPKSTIEAPCHEIYIGRHYAMTQLKDLENPTTAFDDKIKPTRIYRPSKNGKKTGLGAPWDRKDCVEKPLLPLYADAHKFSELTGLINSHQEKEKLPENPQKLTGIWYKLPAEIHDMILRDLLRWHRDIVLFKGWTLLYPQSKPHLSTSVLTTCRDLHTRGTRILYGENRFLYEIRDPENAELHEAELVQRGVYAACVFPFEKYGGLLRNVRICINSGYVRDEHNRKAFMEALEKLLPSNEVCWREETNFGDLTIEMPAFAELRDGGVVRSGMLEETRIPICSFFGKDSRFLQTIMKLRPDLLRLRVKVDNDADCAGNWFFATDVYLRGCFHRARQEENKNEWQSAGDKEKNARRVKQSRATLDNLPFRLFQLAKDSSSALSCSLWRKVRGNHHEELLHVELKDALLDDYRGEFESVKAEQQPETPFAYLRRNGQSRHPDKLKTKWIASWVDNIEAGPADNEVVPDIDIFAYNHRALRFNSAEPPASYIVKDWIPAVKRLPSLPVIHPTRTPNKARNARCLSLPREPDITNFEGQVGELVRQKNILADLKTDKRPLKTGRGGILRASNTITLRKIRAKLRQAQLRKMAMTWAD